MQPITFKKPGDDRLLSSLRFGGWGGGDGEPIAHFET